MRSRTPLLVLAWLLAAPAFAAELLDTADYLKIMTESKLRYNVVSEPARNPVQELTCPRRDASTRVVMKDGKQELVEWKVRPEAEELLSQGEDFYREKKYAEAGAKYWQAIEADPEAVLAYFSYGDTLLFGANDAERALEQYRKGINLDPTLPIGYFFESTAQRRLGNLREARESVIKALTLHPAYEVIWKILERKPEALAVRPVVRYEFSPPAGYLGVNGANGIDVYAGPDGQWIGYALCKAVWANEERFAKERGGDGWSLREEHACVLAQLTGAYNATEAKLEVQSKKRGKAARKVAADAVLAELPPLERHIFEAMKKELLDGYVLFEIIGQKCPMAISMLDDESKQQLESYIRTFIVRPAE